MPRSDITIFNVTGTDAIASPLGASVEAQASSPSAQQQSNSITVDLVGADVQALAGTSSIAAGELFPKTAAPRIGRKDYGDNDGSNGGGVVVQNPTEVYNMASMDFSTVNVQPSRGTLFQNQLQQFMDDARAQNPDHKIYQYFILQETGDNLSGDRHDLIVANLGPPGQLINTNETPSWPDSSYYARDETGELEEVFPGNVAVNLTDYVIPDSQGRIFGPQWVDDLFGASYYDPFSNPPDGYYNDVMDYRPRENKLNYSGLGLHSPFNDVRDNARADWNAGPGDRGHDVAAAYRDGQRQGVQRIKNNYPGILVGGNTTTWPQESRSTQPRSVLNELGDPELYTEYQGLLHHGWAEGQSVPKRNDWNGTTQQGRFGFCGMYSDGTLQLFGDPRMAMNNYLYTMRAMLPPKHVMNQWIFTTPNDNRDPTLGVAGVTTSIMALIRFALCQTLMDDGMMGLSHTTNESVNYNITPIIDEYGFHNPSTGLSPKWLGRAIDAPLSEREWALNDRDPWFNAGAELYKREFENGLAIVRFDKPSGSPGDTITGDWNIPVTEGVVPDGELESGVWREFQGVQDPVANQGRIINTTNFPTGYPLRRMDGRVFVRV